MREVTIAAIQMSCSRDVKENIEKAAKLIRAAAEAGAQIILPSELFERQYFCQERRYDYYDYAKPLSENDAVQSMKALAKELGVVIPVSFYEAGEGRQLFNSVAVIDADGEVLGIYRKTHIPDDHYYQEKFYFTPGNTGFKAFKTRYATIGVGICWDQWFPETARGMALKGAEILFYPTAIGSEPILECDSMPHWRRCMTGHAACNLMPVVAANRIGTEEVVPCAENGNQSSALTFYGSSFITDATGEVVEQMDRVTEGFILHSFDLDELEREIDQRRGSRDEDRREEYLTPSRQFAERVDCHEARHQLYGDKLILVFHGHGTDEDGRDVLDEGRSRVHEDAPEDGRDGKRDDIDAEKRVLHHKGRQEREEDEQGVEHGYGSRLREVVLAEERQVEGEERDEQQDVDSLSRYGRSQFVLRGALLRHGALVGVEHEHHPRGDDVALGDDALSLEHHSACLRDEAEIVVELHFAPASVVAEVGRDEIVEVASL